MTIGKYYKDYDYTPGSWKRLVYYKRMIVTARISLTTEKYLSPIYFPKTVPAEKELTTNWAENWKVGRFV